jgi:hypothetical protein
VPGIPRKPFEPDPGHAGEGTGQSVQTSVFPAQQIKTVPGLGMSKLMMAALSCRFDYFRQ